MPQYNISRQEVVRLVIPSHQLTATVISRAQAKQKPQVGDGISDSLKVALEGDKWFQAHKSECTMQESLAWVGAKLYVPESQRLLILEKSHDSKATGHFGFVKTLHLIKCQFWWLSLKKDIQSYVASCPVCTSAKRWQGKTSRLLQPGSQKCRSFSYQKNHQPSHYGTWAAKIIVAVRSLWNAAIRKGRGNMMGCGLRIFLYC